MNQGKYLIEKNGEFHRSDSLPPSADGDVLDEGVFEKAYFPGTLNWLTKMDLIEKSFMDLRPEDFQPCVYELLSIRAIMKAFDVKVNLSPDQIVEAKQLKVQWAQVVELVSLYTRAKAKTDFQEIVRKAHVEPTPQNFQAVTVAKSEDNMTEAYDTSRHHAKVVKKKLWLESVLPFLLPIYPPLIAELKSNVVAMMDDDTRLRERFGFTELPPSPILMAVRQAVLRFEISKLPSALRGNAACPSVHLSGIGVEL